MRAKHVLIGGAAAAVLTVGAVAGVAAQTGTPTPPATPSATANGTPAAKDAARQQHLDRLAGNLGVTPERLRQAIEQTRNQAIDEAVAAGRLTPEQGERLKQRAAEGGAGPHLRRGPAVPGERLPGFGFAPPEGGPHLKFAAGLALEAAARAIGIDVATLRSELAAGKTLAQIGAERGKSRDDLKAALRAEANTRLNEALDRLLDRALDQSFARPHATATPSGS